MVRNICFRPTPEFLKEFRVFKAKHEIDADSEAMRKICEDWQTQAHDLTTLRNYIKTLRPQDATNKEPTVKKPKCLRGLKFAGTINKQLGCQNCRKKHPSTFDKCQKQLEEGLNER